MGLVRITYDGKLAVTVAQAAERYGLELPAMRKALQRLAHERVISPLPEGIDSRTPLYLATELDKAMKARPGKGANLRRAR
jgi:ribosomal protein S25